jgi:hypothetical protein
LAAKRSACSLSAAAKNSLISSSGGVISSGADVVVAGGDDPAAFFWPAARSDSRSLTTSSPCARLEGVVSLLNFQETRSGNGVRSTPEGIIQQDLGEN